MENGAVYDKAEDGFVCKNCAAGGNEQDKRHAGLFVSAESIKYLLAVSNQRAAASRAMAISGGALGELTELMFTLVQSAVGHPLKSIKSGVGIL